VTYRGGWPSEVMLQRELEKVGDGLPRPWTAHRSRSRPAEIWYYNPLTDEYRGPHPRDRPVHVSCLSFEGRLRVEVHAPPPPVAGARAALPPWASAPRQNLPLPPESELRCGDESAAEDCRWFGSEAGCFLALRGERCPHRHIAPNKVSRCSAGERCLWMAACSKRHREWHSWQECESFYQRRGPYSTAPPSATPVQDTSQQLATQQPATQQPGSQQLTMHEHLQAVEAAQLMVEAVHGRQPEACGGSSGALDVVRCPRAAQMLQRWGFDAAVGLGIARAGHGLSEAISHVPARYLEKGFRLCPNLGLGAAAPARGADADEAPTREEATLSGCIGPVD